MGRHRCLRLTCVYGIALAFTLALPADGVGAVRSLRAASSFTQDAPTAAAAGNPPAAASNSTACSAGDGGGPFDDSVPADIPELHSRVTDLTGHLSAACVASISNRIQSLETEKGAQVRVLLVGSTGDEPIEQYAHRVFHSWKLGRKGVDDGVLLVAALHDHHDRIEVGFGLEGSIPDAVAGDILRNDVQPNFVDGKYGAGVSAAVDDLAHLVRGEPLPKPKRTDNWMRWPVFVAALLLVALAGAVAIRAKVRWFWLLSLPVLTLALVDVVALPFHLISGWAVVFMLLPFAAVTYLAGIFFSIFPKSGLLWLACTTGTFAIIMTVVRVLHPAVQLGQMGFWALESLAASLVLGTIVFMMTTRNPMVGRRFTFGGSSGSSGFGSDSGSSSLDESSSGGGGDSGGGGASGSW